MPTMESELKRLNPELWNSYEHSYNKAVREWLPLVNSNQGSSNALPHLIGVKQHIDNLLFGEDLCEIELSPAELYVLLSAVLMHDIGKASYFGKGTAWDFIDKRNAFLCSECNFYKIDYEESEKEKNAAADNQINQGTKVNCRLEDCNFCSNGECIWKSAEKKEDDVPKLEHAQTAYYIISNRWPDLGLFSDKFARIIARVCCFHDCKHTKECKLDNEFYMSGFGKIRARMLGALLVMGDHLDDTFSRAAPEYFTDFTNDIGNIGKFRNKIQYIRFDKKNKMICSVIDMAYIVESDFSGKIKGDGKDYRKYKTRNLGIKKNNALYEYLRRKVRHSEAEGTTEHIEAGVFGDLIGHTHENQDELDVVRNEMHILGMPIKKWMLECDGHIFEIKYGGTEKGCCTKQVYKNCKYALEPTIDMDYCESVYQAMINVSLSVFGKRVFTYYDILNYMHEFNDGLDKVKTAVRRIERILAYCREVYREESNDLCPYELYLNDNIWTLLSDGKRRSKPTISAVLEKINGKENAN